MNKDVLAKVSAYVHGYNDVNSKLLEAILQHSACTLEQEEMDHIQPFLLAEMKNEAHAQEAICRLKEELGTIKQDTFQLTYLKYKMDMLSNNEICCLLMQYASYFESYELMHKDISLEMAYLVLFFVKNMQHLKKNEIYLEVIKILLPGMMVRCAKEYHLIEFSILIEAFATLKTHFSESFHYDTMKFIENLQTTKGNFGFSDPFLQNINDEDNTFIVTMHLSLAYMKLQCI